MRSGFAGQRGFPGKSFPRRSFLSNGFHRYAGFYSNFFPYDVPYGYEQPDVDAVTGDPEPPVVYMRREEAPIPKAQVIEIPHDANSKPKLLPPTVFVLANGDRLETRRFVLTATVLTVTVNRQVRLVPLDTLDVAATLSSNRERGIDLRIPDDRNEISVGF